LTGIEKVADRAAFGDAARAFAGRTIFMPFREESLGAGTPDRIHAHAAATEADPWDRRATKETVFRQKIGEAAGGAAIKDLDPLLDALRMIKSPAEIAVIREATRIADLGILAAMKAARPGMHEYELEAEADYLFKKHN